MRRRALLAVALVMPALPQATKAGELKHFELAIRQGELSSGASTFRVTQGDAVELEWSTDEAMELHLHGYDIEAEVTPGSPVTMRFDATITGRFAVEKHRSSRHGGIAYLEVHPR